MSASPLISQLDQPRKYKSSKAGWSIHEDDMLRVAVVQNKEQNWRDIARSLKSSVPGSSRTYKQCFHRWDRVLQPGLKKGRWTRDEDEKIRKFVEEYGTKEWVLIAKHLEGRVGKQVRERWLNHLDPSINKGPWTTEEDEIFLSLHQKLGNKWTKIAESLPGRTENAIKNRYNAILRRHKRRSVEAKDPTTKDNQKEVGSPCKRRKLTMENSSNEGDTLSQ